jgi:hypothetical protein
MPPGVYASKDAAAAGISDICGVLSSRGIGDVTQVWGLMMIARVMREGDYHSHAILELKEMS